MIARITITLQIMLEANSLEHADQQVQGHSLGYLEEMIERHWLGEFWIASVEPVPMHELSEAQTVHFR